MVLRPVPIAIIILALGLVAWQCLRPLTLRPPLAKTARAAGRTPEKKPQRLIPDPVVTRPPLRRLTLRPKAATDPARAADPPLTTSEPSIKSRLATFQQLQAKALMSAFQQQHYRRLLADPQLVEAAKTRLMQLQAGDDSRDGQKSRMRMVDYLIAAITDEQNPGRERAIDSIEVLIRAPNLKHHAADRRGQRALAGDKLELLRALARVQPDRFSELVQEQLHGPQQNLMRYALKLFF